MKRELIQNIKVIPYKSGNAIDRERFLSGSSRCPSAQPQVSLPASL